MVSEARAAAALNHPFIYAVHEVVEEDDQTFIVELTDPPRLEMTFAEFSAP